MNNITRYNLFLLLNSLARNIVSIFSAVILYKMNYTIKDILLYYSIYYLESCFFNFLTIKLLKKIKIKYLLILSSLLFSISFYYLNTSSKSIFSLFVFSLIYSMSTSSFHLLRHILVIKSDIKDKTGNILIATNIGIILGSFIYTYFNFNLILLSIIIVILSIISLFFIPKVDSNISKINIKPSKINKKKCLFFIMEQAKVLNLTIQPLYLYLYINNKISYIGIFNIVMGVSSTIFIYFFSRKNNYSKYFKYLNILFSITLFLKIEINSKIFVIILAFVEGFLVKAFEVFATSILYDINKNNDKVGYILKVETIFNISKFIMFLVSYFIGSLKPILYLTVIIIFFLSFIEIEVDN